MVADARLAVRSASAIIDAEVEGTGGADFETWVLLKPLNVWKGKRQPSYRVVYRTSCDIGYWRKGARYRVILNGGPRSYQASMTSNGILGDSRTFDREVDRLIGNPRPSSFVELNTEEP